MKIDDSDGRVAAGIYLYSYGAYIHVVRSPMLPLISEWFPYHQRKKFRVCNYSFATSEKTMLQVRADLLSILGIAYSVIKWHTCVNLVAIVIYNKSGDIWT